LSIPFPLRCSEIHAGYTLTTEYNDRIGPSAYSRKIADYLTRSTLKEDRSANRADLNGFLDGVVDDEQTEDDFASQHEVVHWRDVAQ